MLTEDGWAEEVIEPPPDDPWVNELVRGWALIEQHGVHGTLLVLGGVDDGFDPEFWARYELLDTALRGLETARREREGEEMAAERRKARTQ